MIPAQLRDGDCDDDEGEGHSHGGVIKFDRQSVIDALHGNTGNVSLTVTGNTTDGISFTGSDTIKVTNKGKLETVKTSVVITSPQARDYNTSEKITLDFSVAPGLPSGAKLTAALDGKAVTDGQVISLARMTGNHTLAVTVTEKSGIVARSTVVFRVVISAAAQLSSGTFDLGSHSDVSVRVQFLAGYDVRQIDLSTVDMNVQGAVIHGSLSSSTTGDSDHDGVTDRTIKFDRDAIDSALHGKSGYVTVTITGKLKDGTSFSGTCKVKVPSASGGDDDGHHSDSHD